MNNVHVTFIYIPARSAGGGLAYNFTPQQGVDCLWTQRRGERRGEGEDNGKCKGMAPLSQVVLVVSNHQGAIAKHRDSCVFQRYALELETTVTTSRRGAAVTKEEQTDLFRLDGLRDSGNVSRVSGEQIRLLDKSPNAV